MMMPYRTGACADTDASANDPGPAVQCPTCGGCAAAQAAKARQARRLSIALRALGAIAAVALLLTSVASVRVLQVASKTLHRLDRSEAKADKKARADLAALLQGGAAQPQAPKPPHSRHQHGRGPVAPPACGQHL